MKMVDDRFWHFSVADNYDVRSWRKNGQHLLTVSLSDSDPNVWSGRAVQEVSSILAMRSCINVSGL